MDTVIYYAWDRYWSPSYDYIINRIDEESKEIISAIKKYLVSHDGQKHVATFYYNKNLSRQEQA